MVLKNLFQKTLYIFWITCSKSPVIEFFFHNVFHASWNSPSKNDIVKIIKLFSNIF